MSDNQHTDSRIRSVEGFDPRRFITRVSGQDYLEVKWRLLWLRTYDPKAVVTTELVSHQNSTAVFKANIILSEGGASTGWGSETYDDFRDYLEKAETKAIGRALAALGFGTQFTPDFDFGADQGRVVDAPVRPPQQRQPQQNQSVSVAPQQRPASVNGSMGMNSANGITERQIDFVRTMAREKGINEQRLSAMLQDMYDEPQLTKLDRREASSLIESLKQHAPMKDAPPEHDPVVDPVTGEIQEVPF
jgi:hypothetical protein